MEMFHESVQPVTEGVVRQVELTQVRCFVERPGDGSGWPRSDIATPESQSVESVCKVETRHQILQYGGIIHFTHWNSHGHDSGKNHIWKGLYECLHFLLFQIFSTDLWSQWKAMTRGDRWAFNVLCQRQRCVVWSIWPIADRGLLCRSGFRWPSDIVEHFDWKNVIVSFINARKIKVHERIVLCFQEKLFHCLRIVLLEKHRSFHFTWKANKSTVHIFQDGDQVVIVLLWMLATGEKYVVWWLSAFQQVLAGNNMELIRVYQ